MAYWYDGAALAATGSPVIALFWCLIKFTTTTTTTTTMKYNNTDYSNKSLNQYLVSFFCSWIFQLIFHLSIANTLKLV